jgi:hypothetical protein
MSFGWRPVVCLVAFAVGASLIALHLAFYQDRPVALLSLISLPVAAAFVKRRPVITGVVITFGVLVLQAGYLGIGYSDQVDLGRAALASAIAGESPYRMHDLGTHQNPFAYGPLAMLTAQLGPAVEIAASAAILLLLVWSGAWLTLGVVAAFPPFIFLAPTGINDYVPGLLILSAMLLMRTQPRWGIVTLAVAAAVKPYAAAWFLPAIGFTGWINALWLVGVTAVLWAPLLLWGPATFVRAVVATEIVRTAGPTSVQPGGGSIDIPLVRWLSVPIALAALFGRSWRSMVLFGTAVFGAFLFFSPWTSAGYWIALLPAVGVGLELPNRASRQRIWPGAEGSA